MEFSIGRFDSSFWNIDSTRVAEELLRLDKEYPEMARIYMEKVMLMGSIDSAEAVTEYKNFRRYPAVIDVYTSTEEAYKDMSDIEGEMKLALLRTKVLLPSMQIPKFYTHISFFNQNLIIGEGFVSLSIDNYMGADYCFYDSIGIYNYQRANMRREKIVSDYLTAMLCSEYYTKANSDLLSDMIYYGKILYTVSCLLPDEDEKVIMGYTDEQMKWAEENEEEMWNTMVESHIIYTNSVVDKTKYLHDGPFTQPFGQDSPDRLGAYLGWQIVKSYMKHNQSVTIQQLMQETDGQKVLKKSHYK